MAAAGHFQRDPYSEAMQAHDNMYGQQPGRMDLGGMSGGYQAQGYGGLAGHSREMQLPNYHSGAASGSEEEDDDTGRHYGDSDNDSLLSDREGKGYRKRKSCCNRRLRCQLCSVAFVLATLAAAGVLYYKRGDFISESEPEASPASDEVQQICWPLGSPPPPQAAAALQASHAQAAVATASMTTLAPLPSPEPAPAVSRRLQYEDTVGPESMTGPLEETINPATVPNNTAESSSGSGDDASFHFSMGNVQESVETGTVKPTGSPESLKPSWQVGMEDMAHIFVDRTTTLPDYIQAQLAQYSITTTHPAMVGAPPNSTVTTVTTCIPVSAEMSAAATAPPGGAGHCGANEQDNDHWLHGGGAENFEDTIGQCAHSCVGKAECVSSCVQEKEGYSPECADCFGGLASCTAVSCLMDCSMGSAEKCSGCVHQKCNPAFWQCSGLDRDALVAALQAAGRTPAPQLQQPPTAPPQTPQYSQTMPPDLQAMQAKIQQELDEQGLSSAAQEPTGGRRLESGRLIR